MDSRRSIFCGPCAIVRRISRALVLLDLKMPRFGGDEFRRAQLVPEIRSVSSVPIAVTCLAPSTPRKRAQSLGAVAIVTKPIDLEVLMEVVRRYCA